MGVGGICGCGCKEVYRFHHTTYPYSSCICSFLQQHPYFLLYLFFFAAAFLFIKKNVFRSCSSTFLSLTVIGREKN